MNDTIDPSHAALLVMDYQNGILGLFDDADPLLSRVSAAIALVRSRGGQVAYVRVAFEDADLEGFAPTSGMGKRVASAGGAFHADALTTAIHERVAPEPGDIVVRKTRVGAFSTTDLDARLRARGVDTLLLAGISTSGCVLSTARDAADRDFRVVVVEDASADPDPELHAFLTGRIFPRQGDVVTIAELAELL
jgi:nicotinamidase-related amidase